MQFQEATLYWGKWLALGNPLLPKGMQDAITPRVQNLRNILCFLLFPAIIILGLIHFTWYVALIGLAFAWFGSGIIGVLLLPKSESQYFKKKLERSLVRRRARYIRRDDVERAEAADHLIKQLRDGSAKS